MKRSLILALLVACGAPKPVEDTTKEPEAPWKAEITGVVAGIEVVPRDAYAFTRYIAARPTLEDPDVITPARYELYVTVSDKQNMCEELTYRNDVPNHSYFSMSFVREDGQPITAGTYPVAFWSDPESPTGARVSATFSKSDAACKTNMDNNAQFAKSGTVTLTTLTKTEVSGSFELTYASGTVSGSFTAPICRSFIIAEINADFTCLP